MALAHVQTETNAATAVTTLSVTLTLTAGNAVVVGLIAPTSLAGLGTLSQGAGDTLTLRASINTSGFYMAHYSNYAVAGGSTTFTFNWTISQNVRLFAIEISGMATASAFDQSASTTHTTGVSTLSTGTTGTLAQADEIAIGSFNGSGAATLNSVSNGFALPTNGNQWATSVRGAVSYKVVASTDGVETTATWSTTVNASGLISTYKAAASALTLVGRTTLDYGAD